MNWLGVTLLLVGANAVSQQVQPPNKPRLPPGVYRVGDGVTAPRVIEKPEPEYSDEARLAGLDGVVPLRVIVDANGLTRDIEVIRSLGLGLDDKAIEAVKKWRFKPGMKDGQPVAV